MANTGQSDANIIPSDGAKRDGTRPLDNNGAPYVGQSIGVGLLTSAKSVGILLVGLALIVRVYAMLHYGALWDYEVNSLNVALSSSISALVGRLQYDSSPIAWYLVIRSVTGVFGSNDSVLRIIGLVVSCLAFLLQYGLASRWSRQLPMISLCLIGFTPVIVEYLGTNRSYGLGVVALMVMCWAVRRLIDGPSVKRMVVATLACVFAVQCSYGALALAAGMAVAVLVVCCHRQDKRADVALILSPFVITALSMTPYFYVWRQMQHWFDICASDMTTTVVIERMKEPVHVPRISFFMWEIVGAATLIISARIIAGSIIHGRLLISYTDNYLSARISSSKIALARRDDYLTFSAVSLWVGIILYIVFLSLTDYQPSGWAYILLLCFATLHFDCVLARTVMKGGSPKWLPAIALVYCVLTVGPLLKYLNYPLTVVDKVATIINHEARPNDLVLVQPWYSGVEFSRYYHGAAPWSTAPDVAIDGVYRADLVKQRLLTRLDMGPEYARIDQVLKSGGRVIVYSHTDEKIDTPLMERFANLMSDNFSTSDLHPRPRLGKPFMINVALLRESRKENLSESYFDKVWGIGLLRRLHSHSLSARRLYGITLASPHSFRDGYLYEFSGWKP